MRYLLPLICLLAFTPQAEELYAMRIFKDLIDVDSITALKQPQQTTIVKKGNDRGSAFYYALTVKDLPYAMDKVLARLDNVKSYPRQFSHVKRSKEIDAATGCYFMELRARLARSWLVGNVKRVDANEVFKQIAFIQNHDKQLNDKWKKERRGLINVGYKQFQIVWMIRKISESETQVALVAYVKPRIWIQDWLFQAVAKNILPAFIEDLEKNLDAEASSVS